MILRNPYPGYGHSYPPSNSYAPSSSYPASNSYPHTNTYSPFPYQNTRNFPYPNRPHQNSPYSYKILETSTEVPMTETPSGTPLINRFSWWIMFINLWDQNCGSKLIFFFFKCITLNQISHFSEYRNLIICPAFLGKASLIL